MDPSTDADLVWAEQRQVIAEQGEVIADLRRDIAALREELDAMRQLALGLDMQMDQVFRGLKDHWRSIVILKGKGKGKGKAKGEFKGAQKGAWSPDHVLPN